MNNAIDAKSLDTHTTALPPHAGRLRRKLLPVSLSLLLASPFVFGGEAMAAAVGATTGPTGGTVVGGIGSITQNGANTVINQNSAKLALDWQTFNVGKDASVKFNQPSFNAVALNRILDQNPSQIFGHVTSNGQVFLINTHGIIFGAGAQMNVGGLMASTLDLTPKDFLAGRYNLDAHGGSAGIVNHGLIKAASGGSVALVGGNVSNDGVILADYGRIHLDGADRAVLDFDGNGLINIQVTGELKQRLDNGEAAVSNKGTLKADSGTVVLQASAAKDLFTNLVNNSGVIDAGGISTQGGVVRLVAAGGNTENSGAINVSGVQGGSVQLLSDRNVGVTGKVDASGSHGGGSIRVGGGYQGGEGLQAAAVTYVGPDARLNADALQSGDGGSVVLWSNTATGFKGNISARGGADGGNGGMAEVSSLGYLAFDGLADLRAPHGAWGTLLLDPNDITISDDDDANPASGGFDASGVFAPEDEDAASTINTSTIVTQLDNSDVNIKTADGDITVANGFTYNGDNDRTLTLDASGTLTFKDGATIESSGGADGTHTLGGDLTGTTGVVFEEGSGFITNGGNLAVNGGAFTLGGALDAGTGTVTLNSTDAISQATAGVITAGTLTGSSAGATALGGANAIDTLGDFSAADFSLANDAALTVAGNIVAGDAGDPDDDPVVPPTAGNIMLSSTGTLTQNASSSLSSNGGDISLTGSAVALSGTLDAGSSDTTGDVTLTSTAGNLSVEDITGDTVTLQATDGGITQTDGVITAATLAGSAKGDVTLNRSTNVVARLDDFSAANFWLANSTALTIVGDVVAGDPNDVPTVPGNITLSSGGAITQTTGSLAATGGDVALDAAGGVQLGRISAGTLDVTTAGDITQSSGASNALLISGASHFGADAHAITLDNTGNHLTGAVSLSNSGNHDVTLDNGTNALELGDVQVGSGTLTVSGVGITQATGSAITQAAGAGAAQFDAGAGVLQLDNANTLTGTVSLSNSGNHDVTLDNGTNALSLGTSTLGSGAFSLEGSGQTTLAGNLTTSGGAITLSGPVTLGAASTGIDTTGGGVTTGAAITFNGAVDGASTLTLNAGTGGSVTLDGAVGGATALTGLNVLASAGGTTLGDSVTTTGAQSYSGGVALAGDVMLTSTGDDAITLSDAVTGAHALTVNTGGSTTFGDTVNVASLSTDAAGTTTLGGAVTTIGAQSYGDAVVLADDVTLTSTGDNAITLVDTVSGGHALVVNTGGSTTFGDTVNVASLSTDAIGGTTLRGNVTTTGTQSYGDAVTLTDDVTLASSGGNAIRLDTTVSGAHALVVNTSGSTTFGDTVNVASLTTDAAGTTALGGNVTTTGTQSYGDTVTLDQDTTLTGTSVSLAGVSGGNHALTLTGDAALAGTVADVTALSVSGDTDIGAASIETSGNQSYTGAVTLSGDAGLTSLGGKVSFGDTVDNAGATARTLTVQALDGLVDFGGAVGGINGPLGGLTSHSASFVAGPLSVGDAGLSVATGAVGGITQSGGFSVTGDASFDAGAHAIDLTHADNAFHGAIALKGGDVRLVNSGATILGAGTVSGLLDVSSNGALSQTGALTVDGTATFTQNSLVAGASQNVDLGSQDNDFKGSVTFATATGGQLNNLSLRNTGATPGTLVMPASVAGDLSLDYTATGLTLSGVNVGGALSVDAAGAITQTGALVVGDVATFTQHSTTGDASQDVLLDQSNDFQSGVTFATGTGADIHNLSLTNTGTAMAALTMPGSVAGNLTLNYTAAGFTLSETEVGGSLSVTAAGQVNQSGKLKVAGTTTIDAGTHAIKLDNAGNDFNLGVTASGAGVSITDANELTIDTLTNGTNGTVSLIAGGALLLPTGSIDTGTANLTLEANGGTLVAPGALNGANVTLSGLGDITLGDAVTATGTLSLTSFEGAIGQGVGGTLTAAELTGRSSGETRLEGTNHIGSLGDFEASQFSLINGKALVVSGDVVVGGDAMLGTTSGDLTIDGTLTGATVTLKSKGAIGEGDDGVIDAATLTGSSAGDTLLGGANKIGTLGAFSATNFSLVNAKVLGTSGALMTTGGTGSISLKTTSGALSLGSDLSGGAISLDSADGLALAHNITGGTVELVSTDGGISQTGGVITAGTLSGRAAGDATLGQLNQVAALGNFEADGLSLLNGTALVVNGVVDGGDSVALTTQAGDLTINGTLKGTAVTLASAGAIGQGSTGVIAANTLTGSSQGNTSLGGANRIDTLDSFDAANFSLVNAQDLAASGALTTAGGAGSISLRTTSGTLSVDSDLTAATVALNSAEDLALSHDIDASAVALAAGGDISQGAGVITAGTLTGQSTGTTTLGGANLVGTLGSFKAADFSLVNAAGLSVNGPLQITSPNGGVSLKTTSGILTVNSVLSAGAVSLDSAGSLALAHEVSGGLVTLASGGNISQTASGKLTATTLTGHSAGSTTLNGSGNRIGTLGGFTAAGFGLTNSQSLSVAGPVNGGASTSLATTAGNLAINGAVKGTTTSFDVAGAISQGAGGVITANTVRGMAGGAVALGGNNHIGALGDFSASGFGLKNVQDLTVAGRVNGGASVGLATTGNLVINGTLTGATTTLDVTGAVSEAGTGSIVADTLKGDTTGAVSLTGNNRIGALGDFSAAYLSLENARSLAVTGTVDGGTSTTLTTTSGDLTINGALKGTAVKLDSAAAIGQGSRGVITAATLSGRSTGVTTLNGANRVGSLGRFDAAGLDLTNAQALAVDGPLTVTNGGRLHLATTSGLLSVNTALRGGDVALGSAGDLALTRAVRGDTVTLVSGGNISQTANGIVTAGTLSGRSVGSTMLDPVNHVSALGSFSANGLDLATDRTLTVIGPVDGGDHVNLITTQGDIVINGLVSGNRTTLTSAGAIGQGSAGGIAASTLGGSSAGATTLQGNGNRVATLEAFKAAGFSFANGQTLVVIGPVDGGARTTLTTTRGGDLSIDGAVKGGMLTLVSAGAITEGADGSLTADTLTGSATGAVTLGDAAHPLANNIGTLGGFSAPGGFSLTNARTLNLASVDGSAYTVDAGTSSTYLSVTNGDLLQSGKTPLYNGVGTWASVGHMGAVDAPVYVIGEGAQVVVPGGISPAYFYAVDRRGNILPLTGGSSVNVPTSALTSRAQNTNRHTDSYIDPSVVSSANYRAFGIVPSGLRLPLDQQLCPPDALDCEDE